jgi:hypothetical protein
MYWGVGKTVIKIRMVSFHASKFGTKDFVVPHNNKTYNLNPKY